MREDLLDEVPGKISHRVDVVVAVAADVGGASCSSDMLLTLGFIGGGAWFSGDNMMIDDCF
eukprot:scaffold257_cov239-Chaetoceros_neogracile.AAC.1